MLQRRGPPATPYTLTSAGSDAAARVREHTAALELNEALERATAAEARASAVEEARTSDATKLAAATHELEALREWMASTTGNARVANEEVHSVRAELAAAVARADECERRVREHAEQLTGFEGERRAWRAEMAADKRRSWPS